MNLSSHPDSPPVITVVLTTGLPEKTPKQTENAHQYDPVFYTRSRGSKSDGSDGLERDCSSKNTIRF